MKSANRIWKYLGIDPELERAQPGHTSGVILTLVIMLICFAILFWGGTAWSRQG